MYGSKKQRANLLEEFFERKFKERNYKFNLHEIDFLGASEDLEKEIWELTKVTNFRLMHIVDGRADYFYNMQIVNSLCIQY